MSKIAKRLKRAKSTIKREIERNLFKGKYIA
ncbi:helix-turn-helix domain-containing protein, partial [Mycoplasma marinum]